MGNTCKTCNPSDECIVLHDGRYHDEVDLQDESLCYDDSVWVKAEAEATEYPRLALGRQEGLREAAATKETPLFPHDFFAPGPAAAKPSLEQCIKKVVFEDEHAKPMATGTEDAKPVAKEPEVVPDEHKKIVFEDEHAKPMATGTEDAKPMAKDAKPMAKEPEVVPHEQSPPCLEVTFDAKGEEKKVQIFRRPLGAEFSKTGTKPTKVSKVHPQSYACELGIEVRWVLKSIDGKDVSAKPLKETQDIMKNGLMALPKQSPR